MNDIPHPDRRPIASRTTSWAKSVAARLVATSITPNQISLFSLVFAAVGGGLILVGGGPAWIVAAVCVQGRLLCNLLDGMVAIEGGKASAVGAIYNELTDRGGDSLLLVPLGYAVGLPWLGWAAALLAALTAYVRVFGGSLGLPQDFRGVMAKPKRMAALTLGLIVQTVEHYHWGTAYSLPVTAGLIAAGSLLTCATRTLGIARQLNSR